jgi:hypothetical protein
VPSRSTERTLWIWEALLRGISARIGQGRSSVSPHRRSSSVADGAWGQTVRAFSDGRDRGGVVVRFRSHGSSCIHRHTIVQAFAQVEYESLRGAIAERLATALSSYWTALPGYVIALQQVRGEMAGCAKSRKATGSAKAPSWSASARPNTKTGCAATSQAAAAEAHAQKAQLDFDRATRLYASQSMTKADFDAAHAQYDATRGQRPKPSVTPRCEPCSSTGELRVDSRVHGSACCSRRGTSRDAWP